jgi:ribosomal protein S1
VAGGSFESLIGSYRVGDQVTGWVSRSTPDGAILSLEEGLEAVIPAADGGGPGGEIRTGAVIKGTVVSIDNATKRMVVKPVSS